MLRPVRGAAFRVWRQLDDNGEQSSTYLHVVDRDPVELVITNASLRKEGKSSSWVTVTTRARSTSRNVT